MYLFIVTVCVCEMHKLDKERRSPIPIFIWLSILDSLLPNYRGRQCINYTLVFASFKVNFLLACANNFPRNFQKTNYLKAAHQKMPYFYENTPHILCVLAQFFLRNAASHPRSLILNTILVEL